jgi:hypothetical protein
VLIDCGEDWVGRAASLRPVAILISHAHHDDAAGLKRGAPCGVYASAEAWSTMAPWPLSRRYVVPARHPFALAGLLVEAWPVEHSVLAPARERGSLYALRIGNVRSNPRDITVALEVTAREHGIRAQFAYDGLSITVRKAESSSRGR